MIRIEKKVKKLRGAGGAQPLYLLYIISFGTRASLL